MEMLLKYGDLATLGKIGRESGSFSQNRETHYLLGRVTDNVMLCLINCYQLAFDSRNKSPAKGPVLGIARSQRD